MHDQNPENIKLPHSILESPDKMLLYFFSVLREANQEAYTQTGCGSIGLERLPYPIAYNFFSPQLQKGIPYEEFLKLFTSIFHLNLLKMIPLPPIEQSAWKKAYLIEMETIQNTCICYYYGIVEVEEEKGLFFIRQFDFLQEDFLCAPYHGWQHNAELKVEIMYGNWCQLIKKQYPPVRKGYFKEIMIDGKDGNQYLFAYVQLTNGTDVEVAIYRKSTNGDWEPVYMDPYQCNK